MKLSICVPTRNRPAMVEELLATLTALPDDVVDVEILVGDNSTNDETAAVAERFPNVAYHRNDGDLGAYGNFNGLVARASGEWVHVVADDDAIHPDYLAGVVEAMHDPTAVLITGRVGFVGDDAARVEAGHYGRITRMGIEFPDTVQGERMINLALRDGCPFEFSHTLMRRETVLMVGGFDRTFRLQGDFDLWLRMLGQGTARFVEAYLGEFRVYEGNMLADKESERAFRVERTLIWLMSLARHTDILVPEVRQALIREVRREVPRIRVFTRVVIGGPLTDGLLSLALLNAEAALRSRGLGNTLELPGVPLLSEMPRSAVRLLYLVLDEVLGSRVPGRAAADIGARMGRPTVSLDR